MNVEKIIVIRILRQPSQVRSAINAKQRMWNISTICVALKIMHDVFVELNPVLALFDKKALHQQIGLKFKEETSKVLHMEHSFVWC